jgi:hypothetical protein
MKLVQLTDEGDKPIVANVDTVCFFRYCPRTVLKFIS